MGLKFVNKWSVVVDCRAARHNSMQWTLVNNITTERIDCMNGCVAVEKLRDVCSSVQNYLENLGKLDKNEEQEKYDGYKNWICFVDIGDVPAILNMLDASDYVVEWKSERNNTLSYGKRCIVRIDYKSDRQLLFQEGDKVVFRDKELANPSREGEEA